MISGRAAPVTAATATRMGAAAAFLAAAPALAQEEAGLPQFALDLSPRFEADGGGTQLALPLAFSFADATPTERLSLAARGTLRAGDGANGSDGPVLTFGYDRQGAGASLSLDAAARRDNVDDLTDLSQFVDENGVIVLPPDFDALDGTGTRRELSASAALSLREDRPLGFTFGLSATDLSYADVSSPDLVDSRRVTASLGARAALGGGREATATLRYSVLDEDGADPSRTFGLDLAASANRPRGLLSATLSLDESRDGVAGSLSLGRTLALPTGSLSGSLGVAVDSEGDLLPTASLDLLRESPAGDLRVSAARAVRSNEDDEEEVATTLSASFGRALTRRADLSLDALFAATDPTGAGAGSREAELGAAVRYDLSPAWSLDAGLRGSFGDDGGDRGGATTAFFGVSRRFVGGF